MTTRRPFAAALVASLVTAVLTGLPATAHACWDGTAIVTERTSIAIEGEASWSPEQARRWASWAARIDALVPEGQNLSTNFGIVELCDAEGTCSTLSETWQGDGFTLFELTAAATGASRRTIARARHRDVAPLTVQVAASHDLEAAMHLASRINEAELGLSGFMDVGGFPSSNPYAHVVESEQDGQITYGVVVGAFLGREDAETARAALSAELGLRGFVRPLDQSSISEMGC
jgi:SPOR domain